MKLCTAKRAWPFETLIVDWLRSLDEARVLVSPPAMPKLRELQIRTMVPTLQIVHLWSYDQRCFELKAVP